MTRFWIRNLTSRNDSRDGSWVTSLGDAACGGRSATATLGLDVAAGRLTGRDDAALLARPGRTSAFDSLQQ
jgi:hypothetical protein